MEEFRVISRDFITSSICRCLMADNRFGHGILRPMGWQSSHVSGKKYPIVEIIATSKITKESRKCAVEQ